MRKVEATGHIEGGKLFIHYRSQFMDAIRCMPDCRVTITVEKVYRKRSTRGENGTGQNGYYFGIVCSEYRRGAWETQQRILSIDDAHAELKANCNYVERYVEETGSVCRTINSTADLTTVQFEEYLDRCREFIHEWFGVRVPMPNEQGELPWSKSHAYEST